MDGRDFMEMLAEMRGDNDSAGREPAMAREILIEESQRLAKRNNTFRVGDVVTPRKDAPIKGHGKPHVVVATRVAEFDFSKGEPGSPFFGAIWDTRVACYGGSSLVSVWMDSAHLEILPA